MIELPFLSQPAYSSITECFEHLSISSGNLKVFKSPYLVFAGSLHYETLTDDLNNLKYDATYIYMPNDKPFQIEGYRCVDHFKCYQMFCMSPKNAIVDQRVRKIEKEESGKCIKLINDVLPGFVREKSVELGNYYGIWDGNDLIATAGVRMNTALYDEVSGVANHVNHLGKGLSFSVISKIILESFEKEKALYLHVLTTNDRAIKLYEKLGFRVSNVLTWWKLEQINFENR